MNHRNPLSPYRRSNGCAPYSRQKRSSAPVSRRPRRAVAGLGALLAAAVLAAPAEATFPGANGKIAFDSRREATVSQIWTMEPDGTNLTRLTFSDAFERAPAWSPDGTRIAFASQRSGDGDIYVMDADGGNLTRLTADPNAETLPAWSPDGSKIVFSRSPGDLDELDLYVVNADGSGEVQLTSGPDKDWQADWAPDGSRIAFVRQFGPGALSPIHTIDPSGGNLTRLTDGFDADPSWSPDGTRIAYSTGAANALTVMRADGSSKVPISDSDSAAPAWSPDGSRIAFSDVLDLGLMDPDGANRVFLTQDGSRGLNNRPDWQPLPNGAPDCSRVTANPAVIKPPVRDQFRLVTLSGATNPDGDPLAFHIDAVTQDEPVTGKGDDTSPDAALTAAGADSDQVTLRAERSPHGNGRVYRVAYTVSDDSASCSGVATVAVPRRPHEDAIDDGDAASFDSLTGEET